MDHFTVTSMRSSEIHFFFLPTLIFDRATTPPTIKKSISFLQFSFSSLFLVDISFDFQKFHLARVRDDGWPIPNEKFKFILQFPANFC